MPAALLRRFTGVSEELAVGSQRVYGRADTGKPASEQPPTCSRQQFRLDCRPEGVHVTSLSPVNPTKVVFAGGSGGSVLLNAGDSWVLAPGDRVLLLAFDPSMFVKLESGPGAAAAQRPAAAAPGGNREAGPGAAAETSGTPPPAAAAAHAQPGAGPSGGGAGDGAGGSRGGGEAPPSKRARVEGGQAGGQLQRQQHQPAAAAAAAAAPVVLVMVGLQGAGKSTFCHSLIQRAQQAGQQQQQQQQQPGEQPQQQAAPRRWVRINQDSIAGGRRGTREQCLEAAARALAGGASVVVDRTGVTQDQRRPFVRLAQQHGVQAHCLMLKLPVKLCQSRAAARNDHEGALQGQAAYPAVARMQRQLEEGGDPQAREGFASVLICESDGEAAAALEAWSLYGPSHPDPAAEYARLRPPPPKAAALNTIDRFFKKVLKPAPAEQAAQAGEGGQPAAAGAQGNAGEAHAHAPQQKQKEPTASPSSTGHPRQQQQQHQGGSGGGDAFQALMAAARPQPRPGAAAGPASPASGGAGPSGGKSKHGFDGQASWASSLATIAAKPESCRAVQPDLQYDDLTVWIADKFPKARQHWLVVARERRLEGPLDLTAADVPLLEHMIVVARRQVGQMQRRSPGLRFRAGFHAVPSVRQLHMHVVSQDFDSAWLKNKKHWNSFTSPSFFLDAAWVVEQLRQHGALRYSLQEKEALLRGAQRCHRCGAAQANMPSLKRHIAECGAEVAGPHLY